MKFYILFWPRSQCVKCYRNAINCLFFILWSGNTELPILMNTAILLLGLHVDTLFCQYTISCYEQCLLIWDKVLSKVDSKALHLQMWDILPRIYCLNVYRTPTRLSFCQHFIWRPLEVHIFSMLSASLLLWHWMTLESPQDHTSIQQYIQNLLWIKAQETACNEYRIMTRTDRTKSARFLAICIVIALSPNNCL